MLLLNITIKFMYTLTHSLIFLKSFCKVELMVPPIVTFLFSVHKYHYKYYYKIINSQ